MSDATGIGNSTGNLDSEKAKEVMQKAAALVRACRGLPKVGENFELCNSYPAFANFMEEQQVRLVQLMNRVMLASGCPSKVPLKLRDPTDIAQRIVNGTDSIVDRASVLCDELERAGRDEEVKVPKVIVGAESTKRRDAQADASSLEALKSNIGSTLAERLKRAHDEAVAGRMSTSNIRKPQEQYGFASSIDNSRSEFVPKLLLKHNEHIHEHHGMVIVDETGDASRLISESGESSHPYQVELGRFTPTDAQLASAEPIKFPKDISKIPLKFISTKEELEICRDELNSVKEFAVDLEAHSQRSFLGIVCLMQISTRTTDYIIDPFPLWQHMNILNEPFTNPNILKVFHGADGDVEWLQRDFGIYVVNMLDTYRAMRRLSFSKFGLGFLVQKYCDVTLNKQYQLSDWRIRPLPKELLDYARCDTHYLLYCYDRLREELLEQGNELKNLLHAAYTDSRLICLKVYEKPVFDPEGYRTIIGARRNLNNRQIGALAALWKWRDEKARGEDESTDYVLPNFMMLHIAEALPREMQGIIACCSPVPAMVKENLIDLHRIIYAARDLPLEAKYTATSAVNGENRSYIDNMIDKANRMSKVKALVRCKLDFIHSRFDEEIGVIARTEDVEGVKDKHFKDTLLGVLGLSLDKETVGSELENVTTDEAKKRGNVIECMDNWATPFECYTIAIKEAAKREEAEREERERKRKEQQGGEKRMYSHHDDVICRKPVFPREDVNVDNISLSTDEPAKKKRFVEFTDDQILTKKALKRKNKHNREAADISTTFYAKVNAATSAIEAQRGDSTSEALGEPSYIVKRVKDEVVLGEDGVKQETAEVEEPVEPFDYSQVDPNKFNQRPSSDDFDPFNQQFRVERKKKNNRQNRGRPGFNRMGNMSTSFKPNQK